MCYIYMQKIISYLSARDIGRLLKPFLYQAFGTHTFYEGSGGGGVIPCYLKNRCPHEHEILHSIRDIFERPRNVKVSYNLLN